MKFKEASSEVVKSEKVEVGTLILKGSKLIISDKWDLRKPLVISGINPGRYNAQCKLVRDGQGAYVSAVRLTNVTTLKEAKQESLKVEARSYLRITRDQLLDLVRSSRLRALRNPVGQLCFAKDDLDALPVGIAPEVAVAELLNQKEPYVFDASMAPPVEMTSPSNSTSGINLDVLMAIIDDLRRTNARSPHWLDLDAAVACYGVPAKILKSWAANGFVRKSKLGPTLQSKALFNASDVNDCLCRIAAGKMPVNATRKGVVS